MSVEKTDIQKLKPLLTKHFCLLISGVAQMAKVEISSQAELFDIFCSLKSMVRAVPKPAKISNRASVKVLPLA